jgi:hypothetical protein
MVQCIQFIESTCVNLNPLLHQTRELTLPAHGNSSKLKNFERIYPQPRPPISEIATLSKMIPDIRTKTTWA